MDLLVGLGHAFMGDPDPYSNISHSPIMGLTHPTYPYFKLTQEIHTSKWTVRPEAHTIGSSNIETQIRLYWRHQVQKSYSESVLTYPKKFYLHTIEYYSIPQESHTQSIFTSTSILNHFKLLWARWSRLVNTSNRCKSKLALSFALISIRFELTHFSKNVPLSRIFPWS